MWKNTYKDYKPDGSWVKQRVETGKSIVGCEMNELNGWGEAHHVHRPKKKSFLRTILNSILKRGV